MSSRKSASKPTLVPKAVADAGRFLIGPCRTLTLASLIVGAFVGAWYWGWREVRDEVLNSEAYTLSPRDIVVANHADWIRIDDIRERVFQNASLGQKISIMSPDLNERVAAEFLLHPWVAKVRRIRKQYPARIVVELEYRRPVCVVDVFEQIIPVDREGNALPAGDLALNQIRRFPRVVGVDTMPVGPAPARWGDPRVAGAAEVAAALDGRWGEFGLETIVPVARTGGEGQVEIEYELHTPRGSRVIWGRAPGAKVPGEPTTEQKIAFLEGCIKRSGTLEGKEAPQVIDVPSLLRSGFTCLPSKALLR